jgi:hypothetical protein
VLRFRVENGTECLLNLALNQVGLLLNQVCCLRMLIDYGGRGRAYRHINFSENQFFFERHRYYHYSILALTIDMPVYQINLNLFKDQITSLFNNNLSA